MTFAQYLAQRSGLTSGNLMAHLSAIQSGTGAGETIFAQRFTVSVTTPSHVVTQRAQRKAQEAPVREPAVRQSKSDKNAFVLHITPSVRLFSTPHEITINTGYSTEV